jgi:hypothetical protein
MMCRADTTLTDKLDRNLDYYAAQVADSSCHWRITSPGWVRLIRSAAQWRHAHSTGALFIGHASVTVEPIARAHGRNSGVQYQNSGEPDARGSDESRIIVCHKRHDCRVCPRTSFRLPSVHTAARDQQQHPRQHRPNKVRRDDPVLCLCFCLSVPIFMFSPSQVP